VSSMKGDKLARRTLLKSRVVAGAAAVAMAAPPKTKKKVLKSAKSCFADRALFAGHPDRQPDLCRR